MTTSITVFMIIFWIGFAVQIQITFIASWQQVVYPIMLEDFIPEVDAVVKKEQIKYYAQP